MTQAFLAAAVAGVAFGLVIAWAIGRIAKRLGRQLDDIHLTLLDIEKHVMRTPADPADQTPTDLEN
jgi:hypothetical protein